MIPNKRVFAYAGYNTISMGPGRREFNPKDNLLMPGIDRYIANAGKGVLNLAGINPGIVDECIIGNFMSARFNKQGNLGCFVTGISDELRFKPSLTVEGACASGGLAIQTGVKSILSNTADIVLVIGAEVQNTYKSVYGADILAGADWFEKRKHGHAYYFPGQFSERAEEYYKKYGKSKTREAMAYWYVNAIKNARLDSTSQEYGNNIEDLFGHYMDSEIDGESFVDGLNLLDCSKISDGAAGILLCSENGIKTLGINLSETIEVIGFGYAANDIKKYPDDLTILETTEYITKRVLQDSNIQINQIGTIELHDCFSINALLTIESIGLAEKGQAPEFILKGATTREGIIPINTTGGLIGWGHPIGATGVHQVVTLWQQMTNQAKSYQISLLNDSPYGMSINMGGNDSVVSTMLFKKGS